MKELDNIFKEKLGNYQAPVDPSAWSAIQSGIGTAGSGAAAASSSAMLVKAALGFFAAALISVGVFLAVSSSDDQQQSTPEPTEKLVEQPAQSEFDDETTKTDLVDLSDQLDEQRVQRSSLPIDVEQHTPVVNQNIAEGNEKIQNEESEKQVINVSENNETAVSESKSVVSQNINRGHEETKHTKISAEVENLSASFYGLQDEYDAMRFELIPEMGEAHAYSWELDGQYFSDEKLDYTFEQPGVYPVILTVTGKTGKLEKQTLELQVFEPPVFVAPTVFSPNNDYKNPTLDFEALSKGITIVETQVFSPSGELIFKSDEHTQKWDGNYHNGEPCPQGQYLWLVVYQTDGGEEFKEQGYVAIFR